MPLPFTTRRRSSVPAPMMRRSAVSKITLISKTRGRESRKPAVRSRRRPVETSGRASLISFSRAAGLRPFIGKLVDGAHAIGKGLEQSPAPADGRVGDGLLVGLLVGLRVEEHGGIGRGDVLLDGDGELDVARGLL